MTRKPTEAELIFGAFCDGYMRHMKLPEINSTNDLHKAATEYIESMWMLKKFQEEQADD